jgi:hypothetical protein
VHAVLIVVLLGAIAASTPTPSTDDRDTYQKVGRHLLIRDCSNIHCFRVLVAIALEPLPGPSLVKWKAYAVLANAAAAVAVGQFCLLQSDANTFTHRLVFSHPPTHAEQFNIPAVRGHEALEYFNRRCFASSIRSEQTDNFSSVHFK